MAKQGAEGQNGSQLLLDKKRTQGHWHVLQVAATIPGPGSTVRTQPPAGAKAVLHFTFFSKCPVLK